MQSYVIEELLKHIDIQRLQPLVVDVGASDGFYTSNSYDLIASYGWHGVLIDPQADKLEIAKQYHCDRLDRVSFHAVALCNYKGRVILYGHHNDGNGVTTLNHGASLIEIPNSPAWCPVDAIDYDTFLSKVDLSKVGVLSIDTEGYDFNIIWGLFQSTIKRPQVIITETEYYLLKEDRRHKEALLAKEYECVYTGVDQIHIHKACLV